MTPQSFRSAYSISWDPGLDKLLKKISPHWLSYSVILSSNQFTIFCVIPHYIRAEPSARDLGHVTGESRAHCQLHLLLDPFRSNLDLLELNLIT